MPDHYQKHLDNRKMVEETNKSRRRNQWGVRVERDTWLNKVYEVSKPSNEKYREGWDRIFGRKDNDADTEKKQES